MDNKVPMTQVGYDKLHAELSMLKAVERPRIIQAIASAREHGDLSENAEYHAAKEQQGFIEGRIAELEDKLNRAAVIEVNGLKGDHVQFGATVTLVDEDTEEKVRYQIVGADESNIKEGFLSITAPLARALISKKVNDMVEVITPNGSKAYTVLNIEFK